MTHFSELFTANAITILRSLELSQKLESDVHVVPDIYCSWDTTQGTIEISLKSLPGRLAELWAKVSGNPRWLSFNLSLGKTRFQAGDVLGVIIEIEGCADHEFRPFIRTVTPAGDTADTQLDDTLKGAGDRAVRTLLHPVVSENGIAGAEGYHTLVLPLPRKDFWLDLRDIRVFVVPAERGLRIGRSTLSSLS